MILLVKSLNNSILWKLWFKHWYFVDTIKELVYSYEYEIKWDKFSNWVVKIFEYDQYQNIVWSWIEVIKLSRYFDLNRHLDYSNENSTCMDFCLHVLEQEWIVLNTAIESYKEVKKDIKNTAFSHFIIFWLWFLFWILVFLIIIKSLFDIQFIF